MLREMVEGQRVETFSARRIMSTVGCLRRSCWFPVVSIAEDSPADADAKVLFGPGGSFLIGISRPNARQFEKVSNDEVGRDS
jgi:hypothetical protein